MAVTVTVSSTIIPIPSRPLPDDPRDTGNPISDGFGGPLIGGPIQVILDAIHELRRKIDRMSGNLQADVAIITANEQKMSEDMAKMSDDMAKQGMALMTIQSLVSKLVGGQPADQSIIDAIHAAATLSTTNAAAADANVAAADANLASADAIAATPPAAPILAETPPAP